jgi:RND family efflux transporter MFP subunit
VQRILASVCFLGGMVACAGLAGCGPQQAPAGAMQKGPPEVYVRAPIVREITDYEEFPGRLESDQTIQVRARVTGYLLRWNFKEGGTVKKGDVLFEIDPQLYEAELALAEGNLLEAQGQHDQAKADWNRVQKLRPPDQISYEELNKWRGAYAMSEGKLKAAKASLKRAQVNMAYTKVTAPLDGTISRRMVDPGNLVKADDTVLTAIGAVNPIKAYFDVDERTVARVLQLMEKGDIPGDPTGVRVEMSLADEEGPKHKGEIDFFDTYIDAGTGTLRVRGKFENPDRVLPSGERLPGLLVPGMFVRVRLPISKPQPALLIEEKALVTDQGQKFVYVVSEENTAEQEGKVEYRQVELGRLQDGLRVIKPYKEKVTKEGKVIGRKGLKPDEKVVVSGLQRMRPEIKKVKFKEAETPPSLSGGESLDPSKAKPDASSVKKTPQTNPGLSRPPSPRQPEGHGKKPGKGR